MTKERYVSFGERVGAVRLLALPHDEVIYDFRVAAWNFVEPWMRAPPGSYVRTVWPSKFMATMAQDKHWPQDDFANRNEFEALDYLKNWLLNHCRWYEVYELLERFPTWAGVEVSGYASDVNQLLFAERSPYRLVNDRLARIVSEEEQAAVTEAITPKAKYQLSADHLTKALTKFSIRPNPDYENTCKEAASALEAALNIANGKQLAVGDAVKSFMNSFSVHPALVESANKLFGYASDRDGVRHANKGTSAPVDFDEAKLVIVSASAWVNFIAAKAP